MKRQMNGALLSGIRFASPFVLRTVRPQPKEVASNRVIAFRRLGKRIAIGLEGEHWIVVHLMIAGRFRWSHGVEEKIPGRVGLAAFDFDRGTLLLTEASKKKRAQVHLVTGTAALEALDPGGLDVFSIDGASFAARLRATNHTLKRSLTDPRIFSGIGNAYSDEILHRARLSPVGLSQRLDDAAVERLFDACRTVLQEWTERFMMELEHHGFPRKVTAFRPEMAVHGKYGQPCPDCSQPVQRIRYATRETNYCPACQTGGKLLADRALSRLLKKDWPRTLEELESHKATRRN